MIKKEKSQEQQAEERKQLSNGLKKIQALVDKGVPKTFVQWDFYKAQRFKTHIQEANSLLKSVRPTIGKATTVYQNLRPYYE